jgi:hypothetical protein
MKKNELAFNKTNFMNLKKERDMLKITLDYIREENENLKNELNDMKITAKKNKDMLKEYVYQITNKDKLFEKMTSTIEQLKSRLKAMEQSKKNKKIYDKDFNNEFINYNTNNGSTMTNSNNYTTKNIFTGSGRENNFSFGFNILNNKNIKKTNIFDINDKTNKSTSNIIIDKKGFNILKNKNKENHVIKNKNNEINNQNEKNNKIEKNENKNEMEYFFEKQKYIMEEITNIKDDIQFLMENRNKSKMKEKLNQSIAYNNSLNSSFLSEQKNQDNLSFTSEKSMENSYLSNVSVTYNGPDPNMLRQLNYNLNTSQQKNNIENFYIKNENNNKDILIKRKDYNLKNKYLIDENFSKFINKIRIKKDLLFLIDGKNNVWELIKRGDLTYEQIQKYENDKEEKNRIKSIINLCQEKNHNLINLLLNDDKKYGLDKEDENFLNIEIKEPTDFLFK